MSQARVTDFFSQRKKGAAGPVKAARKGRDTRTRSAKHKDAIVCSPSVHEEFLRVIDEAAGLNNGDSATGCTAVCPPASPRTPKRTSGDAEFDLGTAVFSATTDHSTAKKRRHGEGAGESKAKVPETAKQKTARKKLALPQEPTQVAAQPLGREGIQGRSTTAAPVTGHSLESGQGCKTLCREEIASLKSRIRQIKKQANDVAIKSSVSKSPCSSQAGPARTIEHSPVPKSTTPPNADAQALKLTIARAKCLADKVQTKKEERETEESKQSERQNKDSAAQPAYQRYHNLSKAAPPGLSLPYQYKMLAEMFRSMDTVVAMLHNRCETVTFAKVKQGVQDMMHKRFEESHVCQIKTVFPEAYTFRQEKNIPNFTCGIKRGSYQLTVEPVIFSEQKEEARPVLTASRLLQRRLIFHQKLLHIVKQHHKDFLSLMVPAVSVPEDQLTRWHPRFNVDTVPAVQTSTLPLPPHTEKLATAQEVLDKARSLITPKMEKALVSLALKSEIKDPTTSQTSAPPVALAAQVPKALKGVPQSLLERIRAKEAQKIQATMTRNPSQEERLLMMSRLGELARILRTVFISEKKPALIMEVACNKMIASYRSALSSGEMEKHIRLLAEVAADWLTIHPIRKDFYLKMNKNMEISIVLDTLSKRLKEEERF